MEDKESPTEYTFNIEHLPKTQHPYWESLFQEIEEMVNAEPDNEELGLRFWGEAAIFSITDILFYGKHNLDPVDIVNLYHKCTTEAIIEMVLMDEEKLSHLLTEVQTFGEEKPE